MENLPYLILIILTGRRRGRLKRILSRGKGVGWFQAYWVLKIPHDRFKAYFGCCAYNNYAALTTRFGSG